MKLIAIVITYFPEEKDLVQNISSYINDVDQLIIWENTPKDKINYNKEKLLGINPNKIIFVGNGINVGIGKALNYAANFAINYSYTHLITFDQDSFFDSSMLKKYKNFITEVKDNNIGCYGVNLIFPDGNLDFKSNNNIEYVKYCITSGCIIPVETFQKGCFFDEQLFIDAVDIEYCFRLKKKYGLQTIVFPSVIMKHAIGYPIKTIFGFNASAYSAFRTYYLVRNQIYILRKYSNFYTFKEKFGIINNYILKRLFILIFYETDKFSKLKALIKGCKDGLLKLK